MIKVIGIGEYSITNDANDVLKTFALGSCVAVILYAVSKKAVGMAHIALPKSLNSGRDEDQKSAYFADRAIPLMVESLCNEYGCNIYELRAYVLGGAEVNRRQDVFKIGQRNIEAVKEILTAYQIPYESEHTGGSVSRTVEVDASTNTIKLYTNPMCL